MYIAGETGTDALESSPECYPGHKREIIYTEEDNSRPSGEKDGDRNEVKVRPGHLFR